MGELHPSARFGESQQSPFVCFSTASRVPRMRAATFFLGELMATSNFIDLLTKDGPHLFQLLFGGSLVPLLAHQITTCPTSHDLNSVGFIGLVSKPSCHINKQFHLSSIRVYPKGREIDPPPKKSPEGGSTPSPISVCACTPNPAPHRGANRRSHVTPLSLLPLTAPSLRTHPRTAPTSPLKRCKQRWAATFKPSGWLMVA